MTTCYDPTSYTLNRNGFENIYDDANIYQTWLDIEAALAKVQIELGIIPKEEGEVIIKHCDITLLDVDNIIQGYIKTKHPLVPVLNELGRIVGDSAAKYIHYGITTQNIQQTAELYLCKKFNQEFISIIDKIVANIAELKRRNKDVVIAARTHSRHALPIMLNTKFAVWEDELLRCKEILTTSAAGVFQVMMGGAVGGFHTLPDIGPKMQSRIAELLDMGEMNIPSRAIRVHMCQYVNNLTLIAQSCAKIAEEVYISTSEEYSEMSEGFSEGQIGSSTMPQKINPALCYGIIGNARILFSMPGTMLNMAVRPFEADGCSNLIIDNSLRQANLLAHEILLKTEVLLKDLFIDKAAMRRNLKITDGMINAEKVMMELSKKGLGKAKAHEAVYDIIMTAKKESLSFSESYARQHELHNYLSTEDFARAISPEAYTGVEYC
ncbi:adenylosuccinate lyase family protein [Buttiauxella sp. WJP83]|uniref:class-II fumarase/aspartase family protein n=1 Tax=Buttiauxella sp. WJP83 TaxID=2986951 RepID=UPI0022DE6439|nr:adenylosuccinate lyase family protein [Buttiauxella sp. WJP83]WBM70764.1 adenylosuccinate lyase family protein [Buttiauxella sp. WJP83]